MVTPQSHPIDDPNLDIWLWREMKGVTLDRGGLTPPPITAAWVTALEASALHDASVCFVTRNACTPVDRSRLSIICHYYTTSFLPRVGEMMMVLVYR